MFLKVVSNLLCQPLLHFRVQCQEVGGVGQSTGSRLMTSQDKEIGIGSDVTNLEGVQVGSSAGICHLFKYVLALLDVRWEQALTCGEVIEYQKLPYVNAG